MTKITKEKAKELCIKKWEYIVEKNGKDYEIHKDLYELDEFKAGCAYCELFFGKHENSCYKCPLNLSIFKNISFLNIKEGCSNKNHPWSIWLGNKTKENAQKVLDLIKSK